MSCRSKGRKNHGPGKIPVRDSRCATSSLRGTKIHPGETAAWRSRCRGTRGPCRPVTLRPRLSPGLPFSDYLLHDDGIIPSAYFLMSMHGAREFDACLAFLTNGSDRALRSRGCQLGHEVSGARAGRLKCRALEFRFRGEVMRLRSDATACRMVATRGRDSNRGGLYLSLCGYATKKLAKSDT